MPFEVRCCISCQPTIVFLSPCFSWPDFVLELVQKLYGSQISDTKKMLTNKKDSPHSLIYTYLVFNYIKLGNCDVRILWLDPLLQQLVGLRNRILVNKDLFLYLIYPFLCFVSIFFFQVTTLNLEVVRALARGTNLVVTIRLLCMFSPNSTYPKKKKKNFLCIKCERMLYIFLYKHTLVLTILS